MVISLREWSERQSQQQVQDKARSYERSLMELYARPDVNGSNIVKEAIPIVSAYDPTQAINMQVKQQQVEAEQAQLIKKAEQEQDKVVLQTGTDTLKWMAEKGYSTEDMSNYVNQLGEKNPRIKSIFPMLNAQALDADKNIVFNYNDKTGEGIFADKRTQTAKAIKVGTPNPRDDNKDFGNRIIPAGVAEKIGEINASIKMLNNYGDRIDKIKNNLYFTPVIGGATVYGDEKLGSEEAKAYLSSINLLKQIVGKSEEGGVLKADDTKKWNDILLSPGATREQIKKVSTEVAARLKEKREEKLLALDSGGYNVSGFYNTNNTNNTNTNTNINDNPKTNKSNTIQVNNKLQKVRIDGKEMSFSEAKKAGHKW